MNTKSMLRRGLLTCTSVVIVGVAATQANAQTAAPTTTQATYRMYNANITEAEVLAAQKAWGKALIQISDDFTKSGIAKARATAGAIIDAAYGYNMGPVLFKPTLTTSPQTFRTTREGALAYFVGGDTKFPRDAGFALKGWKAVDTENAAIHINGDVATSMGNVSFTDTAGKKTVVDKTWTFKKDDQQVVRIVVHHSSLPFTAN